jgi:hypothetical protein
MPMPMNFGLLSVIATKLAIADDLTISLTTLCNEDRAFIDQLFAETFIRSAVLTRIRDYFRFNKNKGEEHAG